MANDKYIKYEEVLEAFYENYQHKRKSITTELTQVPSSENNYVAICTARVEVFDRETGKIIGGPFEGIGDASDRSIPNRGVVPHLIRVSETRAKARALKDATNFKGSFADDPDPEDTVSPDQVAGVERGGASRVRDGQRQAAQAAQAAQASRASSPASESEDKSEDEAAHELKSLAQQWSENGIQRIETSAKKQISEMTAREVYQWTQRIEGYLGKEAPVDTANATASQSDEEEEQGSLEDPPF